MAFCLLTLIPILKSWCDTKNRMYMAVLILTIGMIGYSLINIFTFLLEVDTNAYLIGGLRIGYILGYILATIQFEFMLYLRRLIKLYTLPFIIAFYLILGNILVINSLPFIIYLSFVAYIPAYFLIRDGKRKHNGLAFGMGLLFLIWGIGQTFQVILVVEIFRTVAVFLFFLGTRGFYEKYIFPVKEEEEKIMGTWISKLVIKE
jgi:hypothetical protein